MGLCFNSNEKFGSGHNRVCQHIFLLDLAEADGDDNPEKTGTTVASPLISLLAMVGVCSSKTLQVRI